MRRSVAIGALCVALLGSGCGGGGGDKPTKPGVTGAKHRQPTPAEAREIKATIASLEDAMDRGDAGAVCRLYTADAKQTETDLYASCATAVRSGLQREKPPRLAVGRIDVSFDPSQRPRVLEASVAVTSSAAGRDPFDVDAVLVREQGSWRVNDTAIEYLVKGGSGSGSGSGGEAGGE
ncbi:MAG: hypothetical protein QOI80_1488 [Solirubrobacteraceae bacterium]|nr:hypothetical protein [Solirubrobacteraceae bacterium]